MYADLIPLLAKELTEIAYDKRDSGQTRNLADPYTVGDLGRDAAALIRAFGFGKAAIFGS